ncbi:MAG TPA: EAL domain-containing protein, partial [Acidimicrobiales bacterium]|nr:EAL domain-containing protein [Acidimicrobiales bacterium]
IDLAASAAALGTLKELGVRVAIDDFGTGYSSLRYLKGLPVDELKIDRSFVAGLGHDDQDLAIVSAILDMAAAFHLSTTAEGVERPEQLVALMELGCQRAQGFYWTEPLPAGDLEAWMTLGGYQRASLR